MPAFPNKIASQVIAKGNGLSRVVIGVDPLGVPYIDFDDSTGNTVVEFRYNENFQYLLRYFNGGTMFEYFGKNRWWLVQDDKAKGIIFDISGYLYAGDNLGGTVTLHDWTAIAYQNGWATRAGFFDLAYKITPDGFVKLRGTCAPGTAVAGTVIGTLPLEARPSANVSFAAASDAVTAGQAARVTINTAGAITIFGITGGTTFSLDGNSFPLI